MCTPPKNQTQGKNSKFSQSFVTLEQRKTTYLFLFFSFFFFLRSPIHVLEMAINMGSSFQKVELVCTLICA
jgi:hypothetical protein